MSPQYKMIYDQNSCLHSVILYPFESMAGGIPKVRVQNRY